MPEGTKWVSCGEDLLQDAGRSAGKFSLKPQINGCKYSTGLLGLNENSNLLRCHES